MPEIFDFIGSDTYAETIVDKKGKIRRNIATKNMMTPYEKLKSLPNREQHLKKGTPQALKAESESMSDNEAVDRL